MNGREIRFEGGPIRSIRHADEGAYRVRSVVSRSKAIPTGKYPSWKMKRMVHWEAIGELNAFRILDADHEIDAFQEQPLEITYVMDDVIHTHVPDIKVSAAARQELWEIKTKADAESPEVKRRTALMAAALPSVGFAYRVLVAEDLAKSERLRNALSLLRFGRGEVPPREREKWRRLLAQMPQITWGVVLSASLGAEGRAVVCRLILEGELQVDLGFPLFPEAAIVTPHALSVRRSAVPSLQAIRYRS